MRKPWDGGPAFADDPLTLKNHLSYYWYRIKLRFSTKARYEEARLDDMIRAMHK